MAIFSSITRQPIAEGKGGRKKGRETSMCGCFSHAPHWRPGLQPRHVSRLGIEPATLWFAGRHSVHWATPARAKFSFLPFSKILISLGLIHLKLCSCISLTQKCISNSRNKIFLKIRVVLDKSGSSKAQKSCFCLFLILQKKQLLFHQF